MESLRLFIHRKAAAAAAAADHAINSSVYEDYNDEQQRLCAAKLLWTFVILFYIKNNNILSLSLHKKIKPRRDNDDMIMYKFVQNSSARMCPQRLRICLRAMYQKYYLKELLDLDWSRLDVIAHLLQMCEY